jgi:hypothetical protein
MELHEIKAIIEKVKQAEESDEPFVFLEAYKEFERTVTIDNVEKLIRTIDILIHSTNRYEELLRAAMQTLEINTEILECAMEMIKNGKT